MTAPIEDPADEAHTHFEDCDHDWVAAGMWGPYPIEQCRKCPAWTITPAPGYRSPIDFIIDALDRAGCNPTRQPE